MTFNDDPTAPGDNPQAVDPETGEPLAAGDPEVTPLVAVDVTAPPFIPVKPFIGIGATANQVTIVCAAENVDVTVDQDENTIETFCGAYTSYKAEKWMITASVFLSYGTNGLWTSLRPLCNTVVPFEFRPDTAVVGPANPKMTGNAYVRGFPFFSGGPGEPTAVDVVLAVQGVPVFATS